MAAQPKPKPNKREQLPSWLRPKGAPRGKAFEPGNPYRWRPGESGNPNGTPGPKLSARLQEALAMPMPADRQRAYWELIASGATIGEIAAFAIALMTADGDLAAAGFVADRTEGAPEQTLRTLALNADDLASARESVTAWERERRAAQPGPAAESEAAPAPAAGTGTGAKPRRRKAGGGE